jgi:hypothetical protein
MKEPKRGTPSPHMDDDHCWKSTDQFKVLTAKVKLFAGGIRQSRMERYDTITEYKCYDLASIEYTLAATLFSVAQCNTIQSPVYTD